MHFVFVYGTLKQGEPNHYLLENDANGVRIFRGKAKTVNKFPLVVASRYNIPFVLDCAGTGLNIQGEIYQYVKNSDVKNAKEFCNRGCGLSAASLRRLQATPLLQTSLLQVSLEHDQRSFFVYSLFHIHPILGIILIQIQIRFFLALLPFCHFSAPALG